MKMLRQILAIAHTEFRFGLRRGALVVVPAMIGLIVGTGILLTPIMNLEGLAPGTRDLDPDTVERLAEQGVTPREFLSLGSSLLADMAAQATPEAWIFITMALLLLPVATASMVPADRDFGLMELLKSLPLDGGTYLAGKLIGGIGTIALIGAIPFLLFFAVFEVTFLTSFRTGIPGSLVEFFLELAIMDGLPLFLAGAAIGFLGCIGLRSRRAASLTGLVIGILGVGIWAFAFRAPQYQQVVPTDVAAYYVFQNYQSTAQATMGKLFGADPNPWIVLGDGAPAVGAGQVLWMYVAILAALSGMIILARLWLHWKEDF